MSTQVTMSSLPNCDLCTQEGKQTPARYDGRTVMGPWAYMCEAHWMSHGCDMLGTGHGQRLILKGIDD